MEHHWENLSSGNDEMPESCDMEGISTSTPVTGQLSLESVFVGMAAAPFLQALVTNLGTKAGVAIGETTDQLVKRLLHRFRSERHPREGDPPSPPLPPVELVNAMGWTVVIEQDLPEEAIRKLHNIRGATVHDLRMDPPPILLWRENRWRIYYASVDTIAELGWNDESRTFE
ncbi:hypothetical protein ACFV97_14855 [Streptomyces sp. NPDC059913]|uniref:hypothetical protein n=1 Tax=unclassified Streptomyces TaxID=2593676 RepID=UPI0036477D28